MFGNNNNGQLGLGSTSNIGDGANEMGNYLSSINLGSGREVNEVKGGEFHTCAILDDFGLKCWGSNQFGQLGYGDTTYRGNAANHMGDYLPYINLGGLEVTTFSIQIGGMHSCAILFDNSMRCWGLKPYLLLLCFDI